jgi:tRNA U38,U39,U40 pseudouridine synthase TruA
MNPREKIFLEFDEKILKKYETMQRYKITFSYDGTTYFGFQKQNNTNKTIQETIERAILELLTFQKERNQFLKDDYHKYLCIVGSSRTDSCINLIDK